MGDPATPTPAERAEVRSLAGETLEAVEFIGGRDDDGYGKLTSRRRPNGVFEMKAHRVAWELARGPIPVGMVVMHKCDNPPCCNVEHLQLGTVGDNNRDRHCKGRTKGLRPGGKAARIEEGSWP